MTNIVRNPRTLEFPQDKLSLRVPLTIGVTGHRDLREKDREKLILRVGEIFADLRRLYPNTPWIVLTPLAEGADRLVREVASGFFREGDRFVIPMPMPLEAYALDFKQLNSSKEFLDLAQGAEIVEIWKNTPNASGDFSDKNYRDKLYAATGAYIVRHCQILIALWDGTPPKSPAGTGRIVHYRRWGLPQELRATDSPVGLDEIGPVHVITTPRSDFVPEGALERYKVLAPPTWADHDHPDQFWLELIEKWKHHRDHSPLKDKQPVLHTVLTIQEIVEKKREHWMDAMGDKQRILLGRNRKTDFEKMPYHMNLLNLDRLNRQIKERSLTLSAIEKSICELINHPNTEKGARYRTLLSDHSLNILHHYAVADALAQRFQSLQRRSLRILCFLAVIAAGVFGWYAHMYPEAHLLLCYPITLLVAATIYIWAKWTRLQQQYLDYRALAEGMRVTLFWQVAGLRHCVADHYLQQQRGELDWIRFALRSWHLATECLFPYDGRPVSTYEHCTMARAAWVHDQAEYHAKSARQRHDIRKLQELGIFGFFGSGVLLAFIMAYYGIHHPLNHENKYVTVLIGFLPAIAAAIAAYAEKMGIAAEARHFARMVDLFMHVAHQMADLEDHYDRERFDSLLFAIGKEALDENALWVILHRERPLEMLVG